MDAPWSDPDTLRIRHPRERLGAEIQDFRSYISPLSQEREDRKRALRAVKDAIRSRWRHAEIIPYGSYVTGLLLPNSDIDITVNVDADARSCLKQVRSLIIGHRICNFHDTEFVPFAKIPVLAIKDRRTGVEIDITVNNDSPSSNRTVAWVKEHAELKPLFLVLKHALKSLRFIRVPYFEALNTRKDGLASYTLVCLIVNYLQMEKPEDLKSSSPDYYANLLLGFLDFYAQFNFTEKAISFQKRGRYCSKFAFSNKPCRRPDVIVIEDPDIPESNVARSSSNIYLIQKSFETLSDWLSASLRENDHHGSILSAIIVSSSTRSRHGRSHRERRQIGEDYIIDYLDVTDRKRKDYSDDEASGSENENESESGSSSGSDNDSDDKQEHKEGDGNSKVDKDNSAKRGGKIGDDGRDHVRKDDQNDDRPRKKPNRRRDP